MTLHPIAHIQSDFPTKFGIPRQSGMVPGLSSALIFTPPYRDPNALRGLEAFSHLWLIWGFSAIEAGKYSPTVRPPRLGGNVRLGVFATRSPYRPNPLGLSAVAIEKIENDPNLGPLIHLRGADLLDGTPIYDIKPYLPYADAILEAAKGFVETSPLPALKVEMSEGLLSRLPPEKREPLLAVLALDPRPPYQEDPHRLYGFPFAGFEVKFRVRGNHLTVVDLRPWE